MKINELKMNELESKIRCLQADLSACTSPIGDWKIIKIYEARLNGEADPYDYALLSEKRQEVRDEINKLQAELEKVKQEEKI